jgi:hypothetical protein
MNPTNSVYYSFLKGLDVCPEGLEYVATHSCYEATMNCCPTPELGIAWTNYLFPKTGAFTDGQSEFVGNNIGQKAQESGLTYSFAWVKQNFGAYYIHGVNKRTLVTENLICHIDSGIPYSYSGGRDILDQCSSNNGTVIGSFTHVSTPCEYLSLNSGSILFGSDFNPQNSQTGSFTLRVVFKTPNTLDENFTSQPSSTPILWGGDPGTKGWWVDIKREGVRFVMVENSTLQEISSLSTDLAQNVWFDLSMSYTSGSVVFYLNGKNISENLDMSVAPLELPTSIGGLKESSILDFMHFSAWDRSLSPEEILRNYKAIKGRFIYA